MTDHDSSVLDNEPGVPAAPSVDRVRTSVSHPGVFLAEEMEARGWSAHDVAIRMNPEAHKALCIDQLTVMSICGDIVLPNDDESEIGHEFAEKLANAFGTSVEFWINLERQWLEPATERHRFYVPQPQPVSRPTSPNTDESK